MVCFEFDSYNKLACHCKYPSGLFSRTFLNPHQSNIQPFFWKKLAGSHQSLCLTIPRQVRISPTYVSQVFFYTWSSAWSRFQSVNLWGTSTSLPGLSSLPIDTGFQTFRNIIFDPITSMMLALSGSIIKFDVSGWAVSSTITIGLSTSNRSYLDKLVWEVEILTAFPYYEQEILRTH